MSTIVELRLVASPGPLNDPVMDLGALEPVVQAGLVTRAAAVSVGVTDHQLGKWVRHGLIARLGRGVYSVGDLSRPRHDPLVIAKSWRTVISHWSAAAWWGVDLPRPADVVHVTAPRNRHRPRVAGVQLHRSRLATADIARLNGALVTTPLRTALDIARTSSLEDGVTIIDAFMRKRLLRLSDLQAAAATATGPGSAQLRQTVAIVSPKSGSVLESLTRVLLWRSNMLPPEAQWFIRHEPTGWWGYVDFAWPELRVVLECDGYEFHSEYDVFIKDRRRWSTLIRAGWRVGVVTWSDVVGDPNYVVSLMRDLLAAPDQNQHTMPRAETRTAA